jgi:hypothetical protein
LLYYLPQGGIQDQLSRFLNIKGFEAQIFIPLTSYVIVAYYSVYLVVIQLFAIDVIGKTGVCPGKSLRIVSTFRALLDNVVGLSSAVSVDPSRFSKSRRKQEEQHYVFCKGQLSCMSLKVIGPLLIFFLKHTAVHSADQMVVPLFLPSSLGQQRETAVIGQIIDWNPIFGGLQWSFPFL